MTFKIATLLIPVTRKCLTKKKHAAAIIRGGKVMFMSAAQPGQHAETQVLRRFEKGQCLQAWSRENSRY